MNKNIYDSFLVIKLTYFAGRETKIVCGDLGVGLKRIHRL